MEAGGGDRAAVVAILFTDVVGSTELLERVGEEEAERLRRTHFALLRQAVGEHGGEEVKSLGDGLMVVFPSVLGALAAATGMQRLIARHNRRDGGTALFVRVGLHVGEPIRAEEDYFGRSVVVARRICDAAGPAQILASQLVADLAADRGGVALRPLGDTSLKGLAEPVPLVEVQWEEEPADVPVPEPLAAPGDALAGRERELERLVDAWQASLAGARRTVLLGGEPGIGKTRLAAELARRAAADGAAVAFGRCDDDLAVPFQPWVEVLEPLALEHELAPRSVAELARLMPRLADRYPDLPEPSVGDSEYERRALFDAVAELLRAATADLPMLVVLDDLHWADAPSLQLLRHVVRCHPSFPITVVGTYRDTDLSRSHPLAPLLADFRREQGVERLLVRGLSGAEVEELLASQAGHELDDRARELAEALHRETQGNPFFVLEVLRHLAESGAIYQEDGHWTSTLEVSELGLPEGVREVVGRRLGRLGELANQALRVGAVVGPRFATRVVESVLAGEGDAVLDSLDEAVAAGLLTVDDRGRYSFTHALVRQTLLEELTAPRRMRLHRRVAEALEQAPPDARDLASLAHHFAEAANDGVADKAADYALEAARESVARAAYEEAVSLCRRGLDALQLASHVDDARRCDLLLATADAVARLDGPAEALTSALEAAESARRLGDATRLARAALASRPAFSSVGAVFDQAPLAQEALDRLGDDEPTLRSLLLSSMAVWMLWTRGPAGEAARMAEDAVALAERSGDAEALSRARYAVLAIAVERGDAVAAEQLVAAIESSPSSRAVLDDTRSDALSVLGKLALDRADRAGFEAVAARLEQRFERTGLWAAKYWSTVFAGSAGLIDGRYDDVDRSATEMASLAGSNTNARNVATAHMALAVRDRGGFGEIVPLLRDAWAEFPRLHVYRAGLALALVHAGERAEATDHLRGMSGDLESVQRDQVYVAVVALLAEVAAELGDATVVVPLRAELEPFAGRILAPGQGAVVFGAADRYLGMLAALEGRLADAERHYLVALDLEIRLQAPPFLVRTRHWYGRLLLEQGRSEEAAGVLGPALASAESIGMADVAAQLRELLGRARPGTAEPTAPLA